MKRLIKKIFRCPLDRKLIMVWKIKEEDYALGQTVTTTTISIGKLKILSWVTYYTPVSEWS